MDCELCTVHYGLQTVNYGLCTADYGVYYLRRKEAWNAYLESVQYGLDYVLGRFCLYHKEKSLYHYPPLNL